MNSNRNFDEKKMKRFNQDIKKSAFSVDSNLKVYHP